VIWSQIKTTLHLDEGIKVPKRPAPVTNPRLTAKQALAT
jgi:hypothetical protein